MNRRFYCLTVVAFTGIVCSTVLHGVSEDEVANDSDLLNRRYAETYLKLAEVQLEMQLNANRELPGAVSKRDVDRSRMNVAVAREQLRLVTAPESDAIQLHLKYAQEKARVTEADYQSASKADQAFDGSYSDLQITELQLKAEVARLRLAIWNAPGTNVLSLLDHMHWQIERVSEEVLDLQKRIEKLERRTSD